MSDPDLLKGFRDDSAPMGDQLQARIRAQLIDVIAAEERRPSTRIGRVAPARAVASESALLELVPAQPGAETASGAGVARPMGRRVLAVAAVAALLAAGGLALSRGRDEATTTAGLPELSLADLASVAVRLPDRPLGPGQYEYQRRESGSVAADGRWSVVTDEVWTTIAGTGRQVHTASVRAVGTAPDQNEAQPSTSSVDVDAGAGWFGFSYEDHRAAPTDAVGLRSLLEAKVGPMRSPGETAAVVASVLSDAVTPPAVRAAAMGILDAAGFRSIGPVEDPDGRQTLGFARADDAAGVTEIITFDPTTAAVTSTFTVAGRPLTIRAADAVRWNGFLDAGVTTQDH